MVIDECTANKLRVSYAMILVEVDVTQELKKKVTIKDIEGKKMIQPIEYEWKPLFCEKCQKLGHKCKEDKPKLQRRSKPKPPEEVIQLKAKQRLKMVHQFLFIV